MNLLASKRTRERRSVEARLDRLEAEQRRLFADQDATAELLESLRNRIEELEAEQRRIAPCPK